jgi:hypothetical protein
MLAFIFNVPDWATWLIGIAATIGAVAVIWRVVKQFSKLIYFVETYGPVLFSIAEQFKKNGGNSLKDQVDRIEHTAEEAKRTSLEALALVRENRDSVIRLDENVRALRARPPVVAPAIIAAPVVAAPVVAATPPNA